MRQDVEAVIKKFGVVTFGAKKKIDECENKLRNDEMVQYITPTTIIIHNINTKKKEKLFGIVAITDKRILFSHHEGIKESTLVFELESIDSINFSEGLGSGQIEVHTLTKTLEIPVTSKNRTFKEIQETIERAVEKKKNSTNEYKATSVSEADAILKFKQLLDDGILTQEEFEAKKKQLLGV